jgi:hypothetical protein
MFLGAGMGCGRKGPPVPPKAKPVPVVSDLAVVLEDGEARLSWSIPEGEGMAAIDRFIVYRHRQPLLAPVCETCPVSFTRVAEVEARRSPVTHTESIEPGYRYQYKVMGRTADGRTGGSSNTVELIHADPNH